MSQSAEKIELFVEGENLKDMILIELLPDQAIEVILTRAKERGAHVDETTLILVEGAEQPLDLKLIVRESVLKKHHRVHVHRCKEICVTVKYQVTPKSDNFCSNTTVAKVREWAIAQFPIDPAMRVNMILRFCGTTDEPDSDRHIGSYVKHPQCELCFDLILDPRVQGGKVVA